jgi:hypothetical protein
MALSARESWVAGSPSASLPADFPPKRSFEWALRSKTLLYSGLDTILM